MSKYDFFHSTPKDIKVRLDNYFASRKEQMQWLEYHSWLTGLFVQAAIGSCFSKKSTYPECPVLKDKKSIKEIAESAGKTEEELKQELRLMELQINQANANIEKVRRKKREMKGEQDE